MIKRVSLYLLAIVALVGFVLGGLKVREKRQRDLATQVPPVPAPWAVHVATVTRGRATRGFPSLALVKGANEVGVAPRLPGVILEMGPREGQSVAAGDLLARIDTRELEDDLAGLVAQRAGAEAEAANKERDATRTDELLASRGISVSEADQIRSAARSARERVHSLDKQIAAARTRLGYAQVTAPFDAAVAARLADPGELAVVGKPLYRLIETGDERLEVRLPAEVLERVAPGTEIEVSHRGRTVTLHADRIYPSLDERSLGRLESDVRADLAFGVVPGGLLRTRVITDIVDDALLVPPDALLASDDAGVARVLKLDGGEPARVLIVTVKVLLRSSESVAVTGELEPGDQVVTAHETTLLRMREGDAVRVEKDRP